MKSQLLLLSAEPAYDAPAEEAAPVVTEAPAYEEPVVTAEPAYDAPAEEAAPVVTEAPNLAV